MGRADKQKDGEGRKCVAGSLKRAIGETPSKRVAVGALPKRFRKPSLLQSTGDRGQLQAKRGKCIQQAALRLASLGHLLGRKIFERDTVFNHNTKPLLRQTQEGPR